MPPHRRLPPLHVLTLVDPTPPAATGRRYPQVRTISGHRHSFPCITFCPPPLTPLLAVSTPSRGSAARPWHACAPQFGRPPLCSTAPRTASLIRIVGAVLADHNDEWTEDAATRPRTPHQSPRTRPPSRGTSGAVWQPQFCPHCARAPRGWPGTPLGGHLTESRTFWGAVVGRGLLAALPVPSCSPWASEPLEHGPRTALSSSRVVGIAQGYRHNDDIPAMVESGTDSPSTPLL
jgi:hypothetical protein